MSAHNLVRLAEVTRLVQDPYCRLLTLTGAGGIGQTRLAMEAAARQQAMFQSENVVAGLHFPWMARKLELNICPSCPYSSLKVT